MRFYLVSHTHWDREWYRTYQAFRARLVDTVDRVLELVESDREYKFLLDGQSIVLEDYLEIRPSNADRLRKAVRDRRMSIGPWYVQPDSLIPSAESHVRNLLEGRRVASEFGPVSPIAYTPDSFGHPAQYPQILRGFGLTAFVYWRGNGGEIDQLPAEYNWVSPDGTSILACHLARGYGNASALPSDPDEAVRRMLPVMKALEARTRKDAALLMNGSDHLLPDPHTKQIADALAAAYGADVVRGLLEEFVAEVGEGAEHAPSFDGELVGGRVANLLPSVWSTRTYLKERNRRCLALLEGWAEPWASICEALGGPDERPALRSSWRTLLQNQAHDSICGCSQDAVHEQMLGRYDYAEELARETTTRSLELIAGLSKERRSEWSNQIDVAVFNPNPHPTTDFVRFALDAFPPFGTAAENELAIHPLLLQNLGPKGFLVDGSPARHYPAGAGRRLRLVPNQDDWEIEFVARDVPAFGYKRFRFEPSETAPEVEDAENSISVGDIEVRASPDGTLGVRFGRTSFEGLGALEDCGDRGDTYDFDEVAPGPAPIDPHSTRVHRFVHESGIHRLVVVRVFKLPARLSADRNSRSEELVDVELVTEAKLAPGMRRVGLEISFVNTAEDHRMRLLFPTGGNVESFQAATTFDVADRKPGPADDSAWIHPAPTTFPQQGWVGANGLVVVAPSLVEAEVTKDGVIAFTLVRSVGWLSRLDLHSRPGPAGPSLPTPGAQSLRDHTFTISLMPQGEESKARAAELGLWAVIGGDHPLWPSDTSLLSVDEPLLQLSAVKPAETARGIVVRLFNPKHVALSTKINIAIPYRSVSAVRLDETKDPSADPLNSEEGAIEVAIPPKAIRSYLFQL